MLGGNKQPVVLLLRVSSDYNQNSAAYPPQLIEERVQVLYSQEADVGGKKGPVL